VPKLSISGRRVLSVLLTVIAAATLAIATAGIVNVTATRGDAFVGGWVALWIVLIAIAGFAAGGPVVWWNPPAQLGRMLTPFFLVTVVAVGIIVVTFLVLSSSAP